MNAHRYLRVPSMKLVLIVLFVFGVGSLGMLLSIVWTRVHLQSDQSPIQADPLNLVDAFHTAVNAHNVDELLGLFTEDATIMDRGSVFHGRNEIRSWAADSPHMTELHLRMIQSQRNGQRVFWHDVAYNATDVPSQFYVLQWMAILQTGRIKSLTVSLLLRPDRK